MAWAKIQSFDNEANFSGVSHLTTAQALSSAVAIGDTILVATVALAIGTPTVTDQLGNTYNRLTTGQGGQLTEGFTNFDYWWCIVTAAGTPTITFTPNGGTGSTFQGLQGDHFTGSNASSTRRASAGQPQSSSIGPSGRPGTGTDALISTAVAAISGDLLWGASGDPSYSFATEVIGTGFLAGVPIASPMGMLTEYKTATAGQSATFTDATNGAGADYCTVGIAITPAAGGGGGFVPDEDYQIFIPSRVA